MRSSAESEGSAGGCQPADHLLLIHPGVALCPTGRVWRRPWVRVEGHVIASIDEGHPPPVPADAEVVDAPELVLLPGFVNAHTHLALTALAAAEAPRAGEDSLAPPDFWQWIIDLVEARRALRPEDLLGGVAEGLALSLASGTTALLDFAAPLEPFPPTPLRVVRAPELIAFNPSDTAARAAAWMALATPHAAPHAVHTTTPELLELVADQVVRRGGVFTIHLSETEEENLEWTTGCSDALRRFYDHFRIDRRRWQPPRCSPTQYLARLPGVLGPHALLVHCGCLSEGDIALIAAKGATVCVCPATHRFFGRGPHPLPRLLAAGVPVCLGTDSLASAPSLSMWDQVRIVAQDHPAIGWPTLLGMVTATGARALRLPEGLGTLRPGAAADLVLVWPQAPLEEILEAPRRLFDTDVAVQDVYIGGVNCSRPR